MADRISETLQQKLSARLRFYQDIGIDLFYRDRAASVNSSPSDLPSIETETFTTATVVAEYSETVIVAEAAAFEDTLPRTSRKPVLPPAPPLQISTAPRVVLPAAKSSLFDATEKVSGD